MPRNNKTVGISMTPEMIDDIKVRADSLGLTVSAYVQQLIRRDMGEQNVLDPPQSPPQSPPESGGGGSGGTMGFMRAV